MIPEPVVHLRTDRLRLREWCADDLQPFARMNADPEVMRHFRAPLTRAESDSLAERIRIGMAADGWGLWAVEVVDGPAFVGFVGLSRPRFDAPFMPAVEIGWRLARPTWGSGYAPEAARAVVDLAFTTIGLDDLVSMASAGNLKSRRVMEKIGMSHDPADDFENPTLEPGHPLRPCVLYRLSRAR